MKRVIKILFWSIVSLLVVGCIGYFTPRKWSESEPCYNSETTIFIRNFKGYHSGIVIPYSNDSLAWDTIFGFDNNITHLEFGWGDKDFYMAKNVTAGMAFNALFGNTPTVIHVCAVEGDPIEYFKTSEIKSVRLCDSNYVALVKHIRSTFKKSKNTFNYIKKGNYPVSSFYEAKGTYGCLTTCNTWVAEGLRSADVNTPLWSGLAGAIMYHLPEE